MFFHVQNVVVSGPCEYTTARYIVAGCMHSTNAHINKFAPTFFIQTTRVIATATAIFSGTWMIQLKVGEDVEFSGSGLRSTLMI